MLCFTATLACDKITILEVINYKSGCKVLLLFFIFIVISCLVRNFLKFLQSENSKCHSVKNITALLKTHTSFFPTDLGLRIRELLSLNNIQVSSAAELSWRIWKSWQYYTLQICDLLRHSCQSDNEWYRSWKWQTDNSLRNLIAICQSLGLEEKEIRESRRDSPL